MTQPAAPSHRALVLVWPGHLIALILMLVPAAGLLLASSAPGPEGAMGRARMFSLLVDSALWPLVGLFLGLALATLFDQRKLRWTYTLVSGVLGLLFLVLVPVFVLDVFQLRGTVRPEMQRLYDGNMIRNVLTLFATAGIFLLQAALSVRVLRTEGAGRSVAVGPGLVGRTAPPLPDVDKQHGAEARN
jgi:hypothetical protein